MVEILLIEHLLYDNTHLLYMILVENHKPKYIILDTKFSARTSIRTT